MMIKNRKKILLLLSVAILISAGFFNTAHAFTVLGAVATASNWINYVVGLIGGLLMSIAGWFLNLSFDLNNHILQSNVVKIGWTVTRDIANLGFVLAIILIALATILRIESYAMKSTLWKLIVAALLINFSLVIAGLVIDLGGTLTQFFINKATNNNPVQLADSLANSFQIQQILIPKDEGALQGIVSGLVNNLSGLTTMVASSFFVAILTMLSAISMAGLAVMFFIRYIHLTILLILMPLAWLAWIFPNFEGKWKEWWSTFMQWVFFGPMASFAIYLAIAIAKGGPTSQALGGAQTYGGTLDTLGLTIKNLGGIIAQMAAVIGILTGGLMAANKMAGESANFAVKAAGAVKGAMTTGLLSRAGRRVGRWAKTAGSTPGDTNKDKPPKESWVNRAANTLSGKPGFRGIGARLAGFGASSKKDVEDYQKELESLTPKQLVLRANAPLQSDVQKAALAAELGKKGLTEGFKDKDHPENNISINDEKLTELLKSAQKMGSTKEILKARPDLAEKISTDPNAISIAVGKIKSKEADDISDEALKNIKVVASLSTAHMEIIARDGTSKQRGAIITSVQKLKTEIDGITNPTEKEKRIKETSFKEKLKFIGSNIAMQAALEQDGDQDLLKLANEASIYEQSKKSNGIKDDINKDIKMAKDMAEVKLKEAEAERLRQQNQNK